MAKKIKVITETEAWGVIREDLMGIHKEHLIDIILDNMQSGGEIGKLTLKGLQEEVNIVGDTEYIVVADDDIEGYKAQKVLYETEETDIC